MRTTCTRAMLAGAVAALALSACDRATMDKADREGEITAYAEAVALVLLGPDSGAAALAAQRPSPTP